MQEKIQNLRGTGLPPRHMTYTWWIRPREAKVTIRKITPLGKNQSDGADAVRNPATVTISARAPEEWILRSTPMAIMTKQNQRWSRTNQVTPNIVRVIRPKKTIQRDEFTKPTQDKKTARTMTHLSFWKNAWNERTSIESLWPQREV